MSRYGLDSQPKRANVSMTNTFLLSENRNHHDEKTSDRDPLNGHSIHGIYSNEQKCFFFFFRCRLNGNAIWFLEVDRLTETHTITCHDNFDGGVTSRDLRDLFIFYSAHFTHDCSHMVERWLFLCAEKSKSVQRVSVSSIQFAIERNDFAFSVAFTRRQIIIIINFCFCSVAVRRCCSLFSPQLHCTRTRIKNSISMLEYVESIYERVQLHEAFGIRFRSISVFERLQ